MERLALNERLYRLDGRVVVDRVYRYEELPKAVADVSARLGIALDLPHAKQGSGPHYRELYGPGDAEIVAERFQKTIQEFGYEF
jgi:hypothetical protein